MRKFTTFLGIPDFDILNATDGNKLRRLLVVSPDPEVTSFDAMGYLSISWNPLDRKSIRLFSGSYLEI